MRLEIDYFQGFTSSCTMWMAWIMWIEERQNYAKICNNERQYRLNRNKLHLQSISVEKKSDKKHPRQSSRKNVDKAVDNVDNYKPRSFSPTLLMSPAPIVINRSPFIQFCNKKFSISSKQGK